MKKIFFLIIFLSLFTEIVNAQYVYFNKRISIDWWDLCFGIVTFNNSYRVVGSYADENWFGHSYISHLDSVGDLSWTKLYPTIHVGSSCPLFLTKDKYYLICGSTGPPNYYGILIKIDSLGEEKWERVSNLSGAISEISTGANTSDGGFILTGEYRESWSDKSKYLLLKTDYKGVMEWYKYFTDNHSYRDYTGLSVVQTPDQGYCLGGVGNYYTNPSYTFHGIAEIIKTDSLGNLQWEKSYGNPIFSNGGGKLCLTKDSCIIFTYVYTVLYENEYDDYREAYMTKIAMDGTVKWNRKITCMQACQEITWIQQLNDDSYILSGAHRVKDTVLKYISWLYKLNKNGDSIWYREYEVIHGVNDGNILMQVAPTPDNGFVAAGCIYPEDIQDDWVLKTDSLGCLVPNCTGIGITEFNPRSGPDILIFPNPFKEAFVINYNIPSESKNSVFKLYDDFGKLVYEKSLNNSINQLQIIASRLTSGVYFASLVVDGIFVKTQKIVKE